MRREEPRQLSRMEAYCQRPAAGANRLQDIPHALRTNHQVSFIGNGLYLSADQSTRSMSLHNVTLRQDIPGAVRGTVSESFPHLIFDGFTSKLGQRVVQILKHLFPPREAGRNKVGSRVITFQNRDDSIELRHRKFWL